jgi:hypothetical protein
MLSKAELIRNKLAGLRVLDLGGTGYEEENQYEAELAEAWKCCRERIVVDDTPSANVQINLNALPLPKLTLPVEPEITTAFDVLEHLEHPVDVLRWIPTSRLMVTLPNALSPITRQMERINKPKHLFSFTPYTSSVLLNEGGWIVDQIAFQFGKWSKFMKMANVLGSLLPPYAGTGIILYATRGSPSTSWKLR